MVNFSIDNKSFIKSNNQNNIKHYLGKEFDVRIEGNTSISQNLNIESNISISGNTIISKHIIPKNNNINLGTTIHPFKDLFMQGNSIYLSNFKLAIY